MITLDNKRRRYKRLLLATEDALEARAFVHQARALLAAAALSRDDRVTLAALVDAFVIAYGRCFASSRGGKKSLPRIESEFRESLEPADAHFHDRLIRLRNQEFAHSDADVADIKVEISDPSTLVPTSRILRRYSLQAEELENAADLVTHLIIFLTQGLVALQNDLVPAGPF